MIRGLTQQQIADRMGQKQPNVAAWLSGRRIPHQGNLERLAEVMGMDADQLLALLYRRRAKRTQG